MLSVMQETDFDGPFGLAYPNTLNGSLNIIERLYHSVCRAISLTRAVMQAAMIERSLVAVHVRRAAFQRASSRST